jgi:folate-binding protein YgfZ
MSATGQRDAAALAREVEALRSGAALSPLSERAVLIARGSDRTSFLQGMLANDVATLAPGQGTHALLLTEQGRVVADLVVLALDDATWLDLPAAARERVRAALERYVVADDVEFEDGALGGVALRGAQASEVLSRVLPEQRPAIAALPECGHLTLSRGGGAVHVARVAEHGAAGFHLWCSEESCADALAVDLLRAGATSVEPDAIELHRIGGGWARDGVDYGPDTLAAEIPSLARGVSYRKGCYLGQEVMERIAARGHVNWVMVRLTGEPGAPFARGATVRDGDAEVGKVTSVVADPSSGRTLALARVRAAVAEPGRRLAVLDGERTTTVEVATTPVAS